LVRLNENKRFFDKKNKNDKKFRNKNMCKDVLCKANRIEQTKSIFPKDGKYSANKRVHRNHMNSHRKPSHSSPSLYKNVHENCPREGEECKSRDRSLASADQGRRPLIGSFDEEIISKVALDGSNAPSKYDFPIDNTKEITFKLYDETECNMRKVGFARSIKKFNTRKSGKNNETSNEYKKMKDYIINEYKDSNANRKVRKYGNSRLNEIKRPIKDVIKDTFSTSKSLEKMLQRCYEVEKCLTADLQLYQHLCKEMVYNRKPTVTYGRNTRMKNRRLAS
jgi:hypothetical protein